MAQPNTQSKSDRFEGYIPVAERVEKFYERFPEGRIVTSIIEHDPDTGFILMRAEVFRTPDDASPAATGHAFEVRSESYVNKTSYIENCECVPLDAEILTKRGWCFYWELTIGEEVLAYDLQSDTCKWTPLLRVVTYPNAPTIRVFNKHGFDFICTPDHSWPVLAQKWKRYERELRKADDFLAGDRLIVSAKSEDGDSPITAGEAAIIGWVFTDGHVRRVSDNHLTAYISQTKPAHIDEIRSLVAGISREDIVLAGVRTFPTGRTYNTKQGFRWCLQSGFLRQLFAKAGIRDASDLPDLALRLSHDARASMLKAMLNAEGDCVGRFGQKSGVVFSTFQILATLEGHALGKLARDSQDSINVQKLKMRRFVCASQFETENVGFQPVWCPTTVYGTWVMKQGEQVAITGNTGSVGRALALLGFEVKRGIASREEVEKAARMQGGERATARAGVEKPVRPAAEEETPAPVQSSAPAVEDDTNLDADIIESANALGYDAVKVRKWVNQKYGVTGGLESLTAQDKREVLKIFREKIQPTAKPVKK